MTRFAVGELVKKVGGDYQFEGQVVAAFAKKSGAIRYVVEDDRGVLHIYSDKNLMLQVLAVQNRRQRADYMNECNDLRFILRVLNSRFWLHIAEMPSHARALRLANEYDFLEGYYKAQLEQVQCH